MKELVFLLEEESAKAMLETLLPRILSPEIKARLIPFEGKQDLEKQMAKRMRGYVNPQARFIVLRDQDSAPDCMQVKARLVEHCRDAGQAAKSLVRIACKELETFYLAEGQWFPGDWRSSRSGQYPLVQFQEPGSRNSAHGSRVAGESGRVPGMIGL